MDQALDYRHRVHFAIDDAFIERADPCFVGAQKIPWIANEKRFARGNRIASSIKPPRNLLTRCVEQRAAFACGKQRHFFNRQPRMGMNAQCRGTHQALLVRGQGNVTNGEITNRPTKGQRMTVACFEFHVKKLYPISSRMTDENFSTHARHSPASLCSTSTRILFSVPE